MTPPTISVIVPAFNEARGIATCLALWKHYLDSRPLAWEIVVADDGSEDRTVAVVEEFSAGDRRIRLARGPHRGKGAAVRRGMLAAQGAWRFLSDADVSMPPDHLGRFFTGLRAAAPCHIGIGSREAPGARRIGEPWPRHVVGRAFNLLVQAIAVPGIRDTQCGFKLFSAEAVEAIFPHARIDGFAFDVEVLLLARLAGIRVREIGIDWRAKGDSRVTLWRGTTAFADILRVRWNLWRGRYRGVPSALDPLPSVRLDDVSC